MTANRTAKRVFLILTTIAALWSLSTTAAPAQAPDCCGTWDQVPGGPGDRSNSAAAFDSSRGKLVLYGGQNGSTVLGETWELNGTEWTLITTAGGPGPRAGHVLVYDGVRHRVLLFGGFDNTFTGQTDTWEWDGATWTKVATTGPPSRNNPAAAYDSVRHRVVLFGGQSLGTVGDTWEWDGTFWTQVAGTGPSSRTLSAMAYDTAHSRVVLFGGKLQSGAELGDTWQWDGTSWTQAASTGPSARFGHAMVFADSCSQVLLFGGTDSTAPAGDLWGWNGSAWTPKATTGPAARAFHAMAFDSARDLTFLVGGDTSTTITGDVWQLSLPQLIVANNLDSGAGSLREAIASSCPGGTITFAPAMESPITLMSAFSIEKNLTIQGPGANFLTISGNQKDRVFTIGASQPGINVTLSGLTITDGEILALPSQSSPGQGGGIYFGGGTLTIANSTIAYNSVSGGSQNFGGGIGHAGNILNVTDSVLAGNSVSSFGGNGGGSGGGAIVNLSNGTVNLLRTTFAGNSVEGLGGGTGGGGAIFNAAGGTVHITNSTLTGNTAVGAAGLGGAVDNGGAGTLTVTNSTLFDNAASSYAVTGLGAGGGLYAAAGPGTVTVINATIAGNTAAGDLAFGGGLYSGDLAARMGLQDTLVGDNAAHGNSQTMGPDAAGRFTSGGYNLIGKGDGSNGFTLPSDKVGSVASPLDPRLDPAGLRNNGGPTMTLALLAGSPAIDKGNAANDPVTGQPITQDQRGFQRPSGHGSDIGAFEFLGDLHPAITAVNAAVPQGSSATRLQIATVSEPGQSASTLKVTFGMDSGAGVTLTNIVVQSDGRVFADIAASCAAFTSTYTLIVTDSGLTSTNTTLTVTVGANTPPTLGLYPPTVGPLNLGAGTSIPPSAAPTDNGTFGLTVSAPGFTGGLSVNSTTGVVAFSNAGPSGSFPVTVTATDACNLMSSRTFTLKVNQPPTISPQPVSAQQGTLSTALVKIATVHDDQDPPIALQVTVNGGASATVNGVTLSHLTAGPAGAVRANLMAACGASPADFTLTVTDSAHLSTTVPLHVSVMSNTPPILGVYPTVTLRLGHSQTVLPSAPPTDNGAISSLTVSAPGFAGNLSTIPANGAVNIGNARPTGTYTVTVTARDNCGVPTTRMFTLNVTFLR